MTIRVMHVADVLKGGGSEQWVADSVRLASPDIESRIAVLLDRKYRQGFSLGDDLEKAGIPIHHLGPRATRNVMETSGSGSNLRMQHVLRALITPAAVAQVAPLVWLLHKYRIDVMHAHINQAFITGALASLLTGIPCVYFVPQTREQTLHYSPWMFPVYRLLQAGIRRFFTALSVKELIHEGIPEKKIIRFEAWGELAVKEIPPEQNPVVQELGLSRFSPLLLSVGRLVPEKGFMPLLQAFRAVLRTYPQAGLVIPGDGWQRIEMEAYAKREGIQDSIRLPGFRRDVDLFYPACDLFIRPYLFEGVNRSSAPALKLGRPMIGCRTGSPSELLVDGESGLLVPPGDADALAGAILKVLGDAALKDRLARGAAALGASLATSVTAVRLFESVYRECVGRKT